MEPWVHEILACPVTKNKENKSYFSVLNGVIDARVLMKNTIGYSTWKYGQNIYEDDVNNEDLKNEHYLTEIRNDRVIYEKFKLSGRILDVGGGIGTLREFLDETDEYISTDPFINIKDIQPKAKLESYKCLSKNLNLIYANAEFQPFISNSFDWLHLRSMLDHVHSPDLALMEAWRLLKPGGHLLIGISIEGSKEGNNKIISEVIHESKQIIKVLLNLVGINKWKKDVHVFHPTFKGLMKIIKDNGFIVEEEYAQPCWGGRVWYISARKGSRIPGNF